MHMQMGGSGRWELPRSMREKRGYPRHAITCSGVEPKDALARNISTKAPQLKIEPANTTKKISLLECRPTQ